MYAYLLMHRISPVAGFHCRSRIMRNITIFLRFYVYDKFSKVSIYSILPKTKDLYVVVKYCNKVSELSVI